jgi:hypothetical protein
MTRLAIALVPFVVAFVLVTSALAATTYAGPKQWWPNEGAGSSYSAGWDGNYFSKYSSGYDTTVTFIDNVTYGWHATVRNSSSTTYTYWWADQVKRGHCRANVGYFSGSCWVVS